MSKKPTKSECGTFAYHPIAPKHAELCVGMSIYYKDRYGDKHLYCGKEGVCNEKALRNNLIAAYPYYLAIPLHMPTPWEMQSLANQGVDTDILTAEQIGALRVQGWDYLARNPNGTTFKGMSCSNRPDTLLGAWSSAMPTLYESTHNLKGWSSKIVNWRESLVFLGGWDGDDYTECKAVEGGEK